MKLSFFAGMLPVLFVMTCGSVDVEAPEVMVTNPSPGTMVSGNVIIEVSAVDNDAVEHVAVYIDDAIETTLSVMPYTYVWDTSQYADSTSHTIYAHAFDQAGNRSVSQTVTVLVVGGC
jgi:hypothetical protein